MSFSGAQWVLNGEMAKHEIHKRTVSIIWNLRWRFWLKTSIVIDWPHGWAPQNDQGDVHAESSDPNTWYRWWLEKHIGSQGRAWDWRLIVGSSTHVSGYEHLYGDRLEVKFRNPKHASMFALKWG